jgi:hypothetical protein
VSLRDDRQPGPNAVIHRAHRRTLGPSLIAPLPLSFTPQYQTGPRHGQQLAFIQSLSDAARGL